MFRVTYAGASFLTADDIAESLLRYARALALRDRADTVHVPGVLEDGSSTVVELLIGPASQIISVQVADDVPQPVDAETVSDLERRTRSLGLPMAVPIPLPVHGTEELPAYLEYG